MKYLKKFESLFGTTEPEKITYDDFYLRVKDRFSKCDFTEKELIYLQSFFDKNVKKICHLDYNKGYGFIYNKFTLDKEEVPDNFVFALYSYSQNDNFVHFVCYKHTDDWYYVTISQDSDSYDPGFTDYYRCDEFDSLKKLLDKWL